MAGVVAGLKVSMSVNLRYRQGSKQHAVFKAVRTHCTPVGAMAFELSCGPEILSLLKLSPSQIKMPCIGAVAVQTKTPRAVHLSVSGLRARQAAVRRRHPDPAIKKQSSAFSLHGLE